MKQIVVGFWWRKGSTAWQHDFCLSRSPANLLQPRCNDIRRGPIDLLGCFVAL